MKTSIPIAPVAPGKRRPNLLTQALQWARINSIILFNAGLLVGTTAVTSVLGFVYWWLAARAFPPQAVGLASAAISAITLVLDDALIGLFRGELQLWRNSCFAVLYGKAIIDVSKA